MWICKKCGSRNIFGDGIITEGECTISVPHKKGCRGYSEVLSCRHIEYSSITWNCRDCDEDGIDIEDIAEWVDE